MSKKSAKRLICFSASALYIIPEMNYFERFFIKYFLHKLLKNPYNDLRLMEKNVQESNLVWTIVRPPRLTSKAVTGKYRTAINSALKHQSSISRADLSHFMINSITDPATFKAIIDIGY